MLALGLGVCVRGLGVCVRGSAAANVWRKCLNTTVYSHHDQGSSRCGGCRGCGACGQRRRPPQEGSVPCGRVRSYVI